eukprot:TRINITY_DN689_c0_g1_i1.p1 TRINITY_DN689_c0_g1~~TRINITY_DN689_c0_g1_i1.p1  ORF type:complete len:349 (+),score=86.63 TRINITY_DN689_c0_g1_i1:94-1140(+)
MGNCGSTEIAGTKEERELSKAIDRQLRSQRKQDDRIIKLLLLGAGESGKSTIAKQMRILYLEGFDEEERERFKQIIYGNILTSLQALLSACQQFGLEIEKDNQAQVLLDVDSIEVSPTTLPLFKNLWKDPAIQTAFERQNEFQLYDSTQYYFENIDRICSSDYKPTEQDILRSRSKTTGVTETNFEVENVKFVMVDVGGQRSERRKWIHCFQGITAVIFCVAMSEYDLKLYEDETVSRLEESLMLFDEICNSEWFTNTSIILFLNKKDIFEQKLAKNDLSVCFKNYKGGNNFEKASSYMKKKFIKQNKSATRKEIFAHITCATDTENVSFVFNAVRGHILNDALKGVV